MILFYLKTLEKSVLNKQFLDNNFNKELFYVWGDVHPTDRDRVETEKKPAIVTFLKL